MSSLPFDSSSSWDGSGHYGSGHHSSHHQTSHHTFQGDHTHSGSSNPYHSHSNAHQAWQKSSVHGVYGAKTWEHKPYEHKPYQASTSSFDLKNGYQTSSFSSSVAASGNHYAPYASGAGHQLNAQSHHFSTHSVMNCSSSDDMSVVKIWPDGDIWWHGTSKGSLQGIYIKNHSGNIVAKFVDHRVLLWSGDRYVDVGYARNAQEAVYDVCVKYRALGT